MNVDALSFLPADALGAPFARLAVLRSDELPTDLMMIAAQVCSRPGPGTGVGAHTHLHPILTRFAPEVAWKQIRSDHDLFTALLAAPPALFEGANGRPRADYRGEHVKLVRRASFGGAVTVVCRTATHVTDPIQFSRFALRDEDPERLLLSSLCNAVRYRDRRADLVLR